MRLDDCVIAVESGAGSHYQAIRFEPVLFQNKPLWIVRQIPAIQKAHHGAAQCDYDTALMIGCTSFGLFQMLGANIWNNGNISVSMFDFCSPNSCESLQASAWEKFIGIEGFRADEDLSAWDDGRFAKFAEYQNGPGAIAAYVAEMKKVAGLS